MRRIPTPLALAVVMLGSGALSAAVVVLVPRDERVYTAAVSDASPPSVGVTVMQGWVICTQVQGRGTYCRRGGDPSLMDHGGGSSTDTISRDPMCCGGDGLPLSSAGTLLVLPLRPPAIFAPTDYTGEPLGRA